MDSLTQVVLGASVGEAILGKKVGNRAVLWGAIGGTIPDLDVLLNPFLSDVQGTLAHRTFSHSLIVLTLLAPLLGYLVHRLYRTKTSATTLDWTWLFLGALLTHPLLDAFTNYGTMLFYPFSDARISWRTIFIIDPLYTLPLLVATIGVLFYPKTARRRQRLNRIGLVLSTAYLLLTVVVKLYVNQVVEEKLAQQGISARKFMTSPAFFNTLLWSVVVKEADGYQVGYRSLLDGDEAIDFQFVPKNAALLMPYCQPSSPVRQEIRDLIQFTERYYAVESAQAGVVLNDLRFGLLTGWFDLDQSYIFSFRIHRADGVLRIEQLDPERSPSVEDVERLWRRTWGNWGGS